MTKTTGAKQRSREAPESVGVPETPRSKTQWLLSRNDPPEEVPEVLTARDPFAYRAVWQPTIDDQVADIGALSRGGRWWFVTFRSWACRTARGDS